MIKKLSFLLALLFILAITLILLANPTPIKESLELDNLKVQVTKIIDGDTIIVQMRDKTATVRLLGVDASELDYTKPLIKEDQACFALEAKDYLTNNLLNQTVLLERDSLNKDRDTYDRLLRYVYLPDQTLINEKIIRDGLAKFLSTYPLSLESRLNQAEIRAKNDTLGLWATCDI